jgi:hypothetical protein
MFAKRFLRASGPSRSLLRPTASPTRPSVRLRPDRAIQKIEVLDDHRPASAFERRLRAFYADGRLDLGTLKTPLAAHGQALGETR